MKRIVIICVVLTLIAVGLVWPDDNKPDAPDKSSLISIADTLSKTISEKGIAAAVKQYQELKEASPDQYNFTESELDNLGYRLLGQRKTKEAIEIFKLNVESYPRSFYACDSLGEAYMKDGNKDLAAKTFEKSLELQSKNEIAIKMLEILKTDPADDHIIPNLPPPPDFLRITEGSCGEACLWTIFKASGIDTPQLLINRAGGSPGRGLHADELFHVLDKYAIKHRKIYGKVSTYADFIKDELMADLEKGQPVLLGVKVYPDKFPNWFCDHFILLVGYNKKTDELIYHSFGTRERITKRKLLDTTDGYSIINKWETVFAIVFTDISPK